MSKPDADYKVKEFSWHVESIRELFLESRQDNGNPIPPFRESNPPRLAGAKAGQLEAKAEAIRSFCNRLAANVLREPEAFRASIKKLWPPKEVVGNPKILQKVTSEFGVSQAAAAIPMPQLGLIENSIYEGLRSRWQDEAKNRTKRFQENPGGPKRKIPLEILKLSGLLDEAH